MKTAIAAAVALLVCAAGFVLPHHRRDPNRSPSGAFTLLDILREMLGALRELEAPRAVLFAAISLLSLLLVFWPVMLFALLRIAGGEPGPVTGPLLLLGGLATVAAASVNFIMMLMSQTSIGFGGGHSTAKPTAVIWLVPLMQIVSGIAAVVAVFSPGLFAFLRCVVAA